MTNTKTTNDFSSVKVIFFDLYRTLAYSTFREPIYDAKSALGYHFGCQQEFLDYCLTTKANSLSEFVLRTSRKFNVSSYSVNFARFAQVVEADTLGTKLYDDVLPVLTSLKLAGYKIGIISNVWQFPIKYIQNLFGDNLIDAFIASCEVGLAKPDKRIFDVALARLNTSCDEALMIGDNLDQDIKASQNAGLPALLLDRENRYGSCDLPCLKITDLYELTNYLGFGQTSQSNKVA